MDFAATTTLTSARNESDEKEIVSHTENNLKKVETDVETMHVSKHVRESKEIVCPPGHWLAGVWGITSTLAQY